MIRALVASCHPVPTAAVTALSAGLAVLAGLPASSVVLVVLAVLTGQLAIGWSNDAIDARRDQVAGRTDKPVARGALRVRTVAVAALVATAGCLVFSLFLGPAGAAASLAILISGLVYNAGVKATVLSVVPYLVAFGSLPAVATLAADPPRWPPAWAIAAGAVLGASAHLANVLPDLADDAATGVRGLPHRLGARGTAIACPLLLFGGSVAVLFGPVWAGAASATAWRWVVLVLLAGVAVAAAVVGSRRPISRALFLLVLVVAAADLVLFALSGGSRL